MAPVAAATPNVPAPKPVATLTATHRHHREPHASRTAIATPTRVCDARG
jgi:hypothetical protein